MFWAFQDSYCVPENREQGVAVSQSELLMDPTSSFFQQQGNSNLSLRLPLVRYQSAPAESFLYSLMDPVAPQQQQDQAMNLMQAPSSRSSLDDNSPTHHSILPQAMLCSVLQQQASAGGLSSTGSSMQSVALASIESSQQQAFRVLPHEQQEHHEQSNPAAEGECPFDSFEEAFNVFAPGDCMGLRKQRSSSNAGLLSKLVVEGTSSAQGPLVRSQSDSLSVSGVLPPSPSPATMAAAGDAMWGDVGGATAAAFNQLYQVGSNRRKRLRDSTELNCLQNSVPCKLRAKRGCATHPRSIAERVRRTEINKGIRGLQDLIPNMDKKTNIADIVSHAVKYIKQQEEQIQELTRCKEMCQGRCNNSKD